MGILRKNQIYPELIAPPVAIGPGNPGKLP
jgi:hypothetical protein